MPRENITFEGRHGTLAGSLEFPAVGPRGYALFAHCFTCGKDSLAATRISRELAKLGVATLRFDFTGLGGSDGDLANSDFSANIEDLVAAAAFLREKHGAPTLLIGHSLGGTAVIAAAERIATARAIVTIAAPASPAHVVARFGLDSQALARDGKASVQLGEREFQIDRSFVDDLRAHSMEDRIRALRRPLMIMHSPLDDVVGIDEATRIFENALHPKSFVSLDRADHLLSRREDAEVVAQTIAGWAGQYFQAPDTPPAIDVQSGELVVSELNRRFLRHIQADDHDWLSDEPARVGGDNAGPDPYELLLAALGSCTSMTVRLYANRKQWPLDDIRITLRHFRDHGPDCERCDEPDQVIDVIERTIEITGDLDDQQRRRLLEIADRCPVHKTLTGDLRIETVPPKG